MASNGILGLDYFIEYIINSATGYALELLVLLFGIRFLKKKDNPTKTNKYLVYFLFFNLMIEIVGAYSPIAYFSDYKYFGFIENTNYVRNYWLYNSFFILNFSFYSYYFRSFLNIKAKNTLSVLILLFIISSFISFIYSDVFFKEYSIFITITGSLLVLLSIVLFYFELLKTDRIINLKEYLPIYISIGVLIYNLCTTPLDIFSKYFNTGNYLYVNINSAVLFVANIILYSTFITGFIICAKDTKNSEELI